MSYRYIPQENNINFVFPNNDTYEYDVNILHSLNENSVSGTVTNFSATTISTSAITLNHSYSWSLNNADRLITPTNLLMLFSVHALAAGQTYYKPWRLVDHVTTGTTGSTVVTSTNAITMTASQMGLSSFVSGTYFFEFRFIGLKSIYPVCASLQITVP